MERPKGYSVSINRNGNIGPEAGWPTGTRKWSVRIVNSKTGASMSFPFHTGPAITENPTPLDVIQAAITDGRFYEDYPTLTEFSMETGYDDATEDDAVTAFRACKRMSDNTRRVFGSDYDAMAEWSADR